MADQDHTDHQHAEGISFAAFVLSLAHTAAVHFGDIPDPVSGDRAETNLPAAQQMIDILSLLEAKTLPERAKILQALLEIAAREECAASCH